MSSSDDRRTTSVHQKKQPQKPPLANFTVEEILLDDMGYDADVEVIKPDKYEDAESESEDISTPEMQWTSVDEELAARMRQLGREQLPPLKSSADRGRKRRSTEMMDDDGNGIFLRTPPSPGLEVQEIVDGENFPSPAKRRRKKSRRPHPTRHGKRGSAGAWTDSSEKTDSTTKPGHEVSTSTTTSGHGTPRRDRDDEMMDVT